MKTINNETAAMIQEFLENHKKVNMKEVKNIYDRIYTESGGLVYNSHLVMADMDKIFENVKRCTNMELCKYHMAIIAILFEGCGIYPTVESPFYDISNNKLYKFKILVKEADALMKTKYIPFIIAFVKGSYTSSIVAEIIINDCMDLENTDDKELSDMRDFDQIFSKIFKSKLINGALDYLLVDTGMCVKATVDIKYKSKMALTKLNKDSMNLIYETLNNYGIKYEDDQSIIDDIDYSGDDEDDNI